MSLLSGPLLYDASNVRFVCPLTCALAVRFTMDEDSGTRFNKVCEGTMASVEAADISKNPLQRRLMEYMICP